MSLEQEIRAEIENIKKLKLAVGNINNHLSALEGMCREDKRKQVDEAYQRGLDDAWEAARKIAQEWEEDSDTEHRVVIDDSIRITLDSMTAHEAIAKLKAYEDGEKADSIKVGDKVIAPCGKAIVTAIKNEFVYYLYADGDCGCIESKNLTKTGKHYDIASILEAMRE